MSLFKPEKDYFSLPRFFFRITAIWTLNLKSYFPKSLEKMANTLEFLYRAFIILNSMHLFFVSLIDTVIRAKTEKFIDVCDAIINTGILFWPYFPCLFFFMYREKDFEQLFALMNMKFRNRSAPGLTCIFMKKGLITARKIMKVSNIFCFINGTCFVCLPLIVGTHVLPVGGQYPFDVMVR